MSERPPWWHPLGEAARGLVVILSHSMVAAGVVIAAWCLERLLHLLWGEKLPKLFDLIELKYVIQAMEAGVIVAVLIYGTISAIKAFKE